MASVLPIIRQGEKSTKHYISFYNPQTNKKKLARQNNNYLNQLHLLIYNSFKSRIRYTFISSNHNLIKGRKL